MKRILRRCLIVGGVLAVLWCTPLSIPFASRLQYNADEPSRASSITIADAGVVVTLWVKQQPRAIFYEGDYRELEVESAGHSNEYYTLVPRFSVDDLGLAAFWFPTQQLIRVVDSAKQFGPDESVIDLKTHAIIHVERERDGAVYTSESLHSSARLVFPPYSAKWSFGRLESSDPSERHFLPRRSEYEWVLLRSEEPERVAPTGGVFVGMLEARITNAVASGR